MRIRKESIYVTACARSCNELVGDGLAILLVLHHLGGRDRGGLLPALLIAEDALLQTPELVVFALLFQQLFVGAALYDLAVSMTRMRSQSRMVERRWATISIERSASWL